MVSKTAVSTIYQGRKEVKKEKRLTKPAPRLVKAFCNEVCRVEILEVVLPFKGVMPTCVWHVSGLEPTVKDVLVQAVSYTDETSYRVKLKDYIGVRKPKSPNLIG